MYLMFGNTGLNVNRNHLIFANAEDVMYRVMYVMFVIAGIIHVYINIGKCT